MSGTDSSLFAALTDVGRQRDHNEDNFLVDRKLGLYLVCDGMGGHAAGEVASALAVRTVHEEVKREADLIRDFAEARSGGAKVTRRDLLNMLEFAVNRASARVHAEANKDASKRGMGTTLVGVLLVGATAFVVWVGDSRIYLLRDGVIEQITEDHNVHNELIKRRKLSKEQVEQLAPRNAITRAVGVYEHAEPETIVIDVTGGDRFLLCSDGLSQYFEDERLTELGRLLSVPEAEEAAKRLIGAANEAGGSDNITTVIVGYGEVGVRDENRARRLQRQRDTLARMPLFRPLNDREILRVLQVTTVAAYADGEAIVREGELGEALYIVLTGQVAVAAGGTQLKTLGEGEHFGEMALIRSQPRSATVSASGVCEVMVIRRSDFFEILRKEHQLAVKLLWQFTGVLADRLAETNRVLDQARELAAEDVTAELYDEDDDENRKTLVPALPG
ncbi:MAG: cyclic nucleotide-binding domain-containing protein [Polyangiaceae bacterium]|nr:cyclic nucleotide-binding domain-containing protein [Polyangiaceae bacterium]